LFGFEFEIPHDIHANTYEGNTVCRMRPVMFIVAKTISKCCI